MADKDRISYFQYFRDQGIPVFIKVDLSEFDTSLYSFLVRQRFTELKGVEVAEAEAELDKNPKARLLSFELAGPISGRQIDMAMESDRFGVESVVPRDGFRVYRYRGHALMMYSFGVQEWRMGAYQDFADKPHTAKAQVIINRFLSLALAPLGYLGLWSVPVEEGLVVMKPNDGKGEAVYIDVVKRKILSLDGVKTIKSRFQILRLDPMLTNRNIRMSHEELLSFLTVHTTYFDYQGPSVPVRQLLQSFSRLCEGLIHPKESFKPRSDLSL